MTRVLYINHTSIVGGAETNLISILEAAQTTDIEPVAVLLPGDGPLVTQVQAVGVPVGFIRYYGWRSRNPLRYLQTLRQLCLWVRHTQAEIIHLNHHWLVEYAVMVGRLTGVPVVCHVRGLLNEQSIRGFRHWLNQVDRVIVESKAVFNRLNTLRVVPTRTLLIHNGVDLNKLQFPAQTRSQEEARVADALASVVGFVGRLVPEKGVEDFIYAARIIQHSMPGVRFLVVGQDQEDGKYAQHLKQLTQELLLDEQVHFTGFRTDIPQVLKLITICVLPSRREMPEGSPLIVLEALAAGCVVVATPNSGVPEVVQDEETGFLVLPNDPNALAEGILRALHLSPEKKAAMICAAQLAVKERFSIQQQVRQLEALYRNVLTEYRYGKAKQGERDWDGK